MSQSTAFFGFPSAPREPSPIGDEDRNGGVDALKALGAFGIVLFHLKGPGAPIGYAALTIFIALSVYYCLRQSERLDLPTIMRNRALRLLAPWIFWSIIFAALKTNRAVLNGTPIENEFDIWMLGTGPAIHLWFLPFVAATSLLAIGLNRLLYHVSRQMAALGLATLSLGCFAIGSQSLPDPFAQWAFGMPAVLMAIGFHQIGNPERLVSIGLWAAPPALAVAFGWTDGIPQLAITFAILSFVLSVKLPSPSLLRYMAGLSLGIYIIHPIIISIGMRLADPSVLEHSLTVSFAAFVLSALVTAVLQQTSMVRRFI